jgi:hypothetical protein
MRLQARCRRCMATAFRPIAKQEWDMHQIIYLVGLIVVILAILSFFGLR